jgi:DNA polymerase III subunit gamma/tau
VERLERLAGLPGAESPAPQASAPPSATRGVASGDASTQPEAAPRGPAEGTPLVTGAGSSGASVEREAEAVAGEATVSPERVSEAAPSTKERKGRTSEPEPRGDREASAEAPVAGPHAPATGAVDTEMLRRSWPQVVDALKARRAMRLYASCQLATVGSFDGTTLELVFPPGRDVAAAKVTELSADLVEVLRELFGVAPTVTCTVREGSAIDLTDDEPPPSPEAAEALLKTQFGAELVEED